MNNWRKALSVARLELSTGAASFLLQFFIAIFFALFLGIAFNDDLTNASIVFDMFFLTLFSIFPSWLKSKDSQYQKVNGELWASHIFIMHKQLPIDEDVIVKSRFIIHFVYSLPMLALILCVTYPFISSAITPFEYIAFSIIWLSFSVYIGLIMGASDAGDYVNVKTMLQSILIIALFYALIIGIFHFILEISIVYGAVLMAKQFPLLSIIVSIVLSLVGIKYWQGFMKKTIRKMDYF